MSVAHIVSPKSPALPGALVLACFGLSVAHAVYLAAAFASFRLPASHAT